MLSGTLKLARGLIQQRPSLAAIGALRSVSTSPATAFERFDFLHPQLTERHGMGVVQDPVTNKGTGFSIAERDRLGIRGLVPPRTLELDEQVAKIMAGWEEEPTDVEKHAYLNSLQDRNETLYFRILMDNIEQMAPIVYTPTVGVVCQKFGSLFRRTRGMYFSSQDRGQMAAMTYNWEHDDVDVIVVTDGSRILGLGDLGANGMGIPIGKLALYVAAGGIDPRRVLPVMLDCGTNNAELLKNPYYLGMQHPRLRGEEYFSLVHEFVEAVAARWPKALIQFEDFSSDHAYPILDAYRHRFLCFNDDIQGTGAVTLAGVLGALRMRGMEKLSDQRFVVVGAGSAGTGVASSILQAMRDEGLSEEEALKRFWLLDEFGVIGQSRDPSSLSDLQREFQRQDMAGDTDLLETIEEVKPTVLLGVTGVPGIFQEKHLRAMASYDHRPIIFPLSNPTASAECTAAQAYEWTDGRAIVASGSPFEPHFRNGQKLIPSQCNNMFIFPGVGMGAVAVNAKRISNSMLLEAARTLADSVKQEELDSGMVFPAVSDIREVSQKVATAVAKSAIADGIANFIPPGPVEKYIERKMWDPVYVPLVQA